MDRMDAYTRLFNLKDSNRLDTSYYIRKLSASEGDVPEEVVNYLVENDPDYMGEADEYPDEDYNDGLLEPNEESDDYDNDEYVEVDPNIVINDRPEDPDLFVVEGDENTEELEDTDKLLSDLFDEVVNDFIEHTKKSPVYRKIRNSDKPESLCKSVSSFCTRYLIELHSSEYDSELVKEAVAGRIDIAQLLRLLANYVESDDLNSLAKAVVIIRNFLKSAEPSEDNR